MMKTLTFFVCLLIGVQVSAQVNTQITAPLIVAKIPLGERVIFEGTAFTFESVIEDSRCPKNVTCIWEGEARIHVIIETASDRMVKKNDFSWGAFWHRRRKYAG